MSNFNALFALMRAQLFLNRKLILWLAIAFGLLFLFTGNTGPALSPIYQIALFVGGGLMSIAAFKDLHDANFNIQYLTLPVSSTVRYLAMWLLTGPGYLIFLTLLYGLAVGVHLIGGTFWGFTNPDLLCMTIWYYLMLNAFFLLGSVYFKKLPLVKSLLCLLIVGIGLLLLSNALFNLGWWQINDLIQNGVWSVLAVLAWFGGYFSLKRVELY